MDMGIKNNITTSISYTCRGQEIIAKMTHYITNINSTKAELFVIRCEINHAIHLPNVNYIIVITDAIPAARWIIDMLIHLYQLHFIMISKDLKKVFNKDPNNIIEFWDYPDSVK